MISIAVNISCEHQGCTVGTMGQIPLNDFVGSYTQDEVYMTVADTDAYIEVADGWVVELRRRGARAWCPQHASEAQL